MKFILFLTSILFLFYNMYSQNTVKSDSLAQLGDKKVLARQYLVAIDLYDQAIKENPSNGLVFISRGKANSKIRRYKEAIQDYTNALKVNEKFVYAYVDRGVAKGFLKDREGAMADFSRASQLNPREPYVFINKAKTYEQLGELTPAIKEVTNLIAFDPNNVDALLLRAELYAEKKDQESSINDLNTIVKLSPANLNSYLKRGKLKLEYFYDNDGAIEDFTKAIDLNEDYALSYVYRGNVKILQNDVDAALEDFNKAIELESKNAQNYVQRGNCERKFNKYADALKDYNTAIQLDERYADAYNERGILKRYKKDFAGACADFELANQYIATKDNYNEYCNPESFLLKGRLDYGKKKYAEALEHFNKAIEINAKNNIYFYDRAATKVKLKDYEGAIADRKSALELGFDEKQDTLAKYCVDAKSEPELCKLALAKCGIGQFDEAMRDADKAIALKAVSADAYMIKAKVYVSDDKYAEALSASNHAIQLDPDNALAYLTRAYAKFHLEDEKGCIKDYEDAMSRATELRKTEGIIVSNLFFGRASDKFDFGYFDQAVAAFDVAIQLNSNNSKAYIMRGKAKLALKDKDGACKDFRRAEDLKDTDALDLIKDNKCK